MLLDNMSKSSVFSRKFSTAITQLSFLLFAIRFILGTLYVSVTILYFKENDMPFWWFCKVQNNRYKSFFIHYFKYQKMIKI